MTLEERLVRAHVQLEIVSRHKHDSKAVALARHTAYEVRLVEFRQASSANAFAFWLELFDCNDRIAIDGGGSNDLEEAVMFAEELIASAKELSEDRFRRCKSTDNRPTFICEPQAAARSTFKITAR